MKKRDFVYFITLHIIPGNTQGTIGQGARCRKIIGLAFKILLWFAPAIAKAFLTNPLNLVKINLYYNFDTKSYRSMSVTSSTSVTCL